MSWNSAPAEATILVVDDLERPRRALASVLREAGHAVVEAGDGESAWQAFCRHQPDLVITDMVMPRSDGIDLLARIRARSEVPVILFTAYGSVEAAVSALKGGADEFVASTDVDVDELLAHVSKALEGRSHAAGADLATRLHGESEAITRVRNRLAGLAPLQAPVLVSGERGCGHDTVVRAVHETGANTGAELQAFTGRDFSPQQPLPLRGAIHIRGIHELSPEAQSFWAERLAGSTRSTSRIEPGAVRVFASTTERLTRRVGEGRFHRELGRLLLRFHIQLPPLRRRAEDIPAIAQAMAERISCSLSRRPPRLSASALEFLAAQRWPGNLVQLEAVLERSIAFTRGSELRRHVVEEVYAESQESLASIREHHRVTERDLLIRTMRETGGNVSRTADLLGKSRSAVYRLIERHGIPLRRDG